MKTELYIHSAIGNTPVTDRGSNYCDLLAYIVTDCATIEEAKTLAIELKKTVKHAYRVAYDVPEHDNQNLNHGII